MSVLSKARPSSDDVRRVALAALTAALDEGKKQPQAPKRKGGLRSGVRTVAAGAALYVAGRAAYKNRDTILEQIDQLQDGRAEGDEEFEDEDEEPASEEDEDFDEEESDEPEAEDDEDFDEEESDEPEAEDDEDFEEEDEEALDPVDRPPEPPESEEDEEPADADAEPVGR